MRSPCLKVLTIALMSMGVIIHQASAKGYEGKPVNAAQQLAAGQVAPSFSDGEVHDFLQQVHRAEAISDPLQRCIAYPAPPGSHWSAAVVQANCGYHMQAVMPYQDMKALVESGRAAELDAYLKHAQQKQLTRPDSRSLLDYIYFSRFLDPSTEALNLIEAWHRQQPKSAFALTARGRVYLERAWQDRGGQYASQTPPENFARMEHWLQLARKDLDQAIAIDPKIIAAYSAMMSIGMLEGDRAYVANASRRALAVQPGNFYIYGMRVLVAEPKWGGSIDEMKRIVQEAQTHAKDNELLKLLLPAPAAYAANLSGCDCDDPAKLSAYRRILDQMPTVEVLAASASALDKAGKTQLAVVYQSEVLRFRQSDDMLRVRRIPNLIASGEKTWAKKEGDDLLAKPSVDPAAVSALIQVYMSLGDQESVKKAFAKMDELRPK